MNTVDEVKPKGVVPMVLYLCKTCGKRFACEAPQHANGPMACPYCHGAKTASSVPERAKAGSGISRAACPSSERPHRSGAAAQAIHCRRRPGHGWEVFGWVAGMVGIAAAALVLVLALSPDQGSAQVQALEKDAPRTTGQTTAGADGATALASEEQPAEKALDAERKASKAFAKLEARLKQLPPGDTVRRNTLFQAFLREHGKTIVASRVRVQMHAKDR